MEIEKIQVLNGLNVWSADQKKLIQMRLNIGSYHLLTSNRISGFTDRIKTMMPSLYMHKCSHGMVGSFFNKIDEGVSIPYIIQHIALELQCLVGMQTNFGITVKANSPEIYNVVINYINEDAGMYAALAAVEITEALIKGKPYFIKHDINRLQNLYQEYQQKQSQTTIENNVKVA